MEDTIKVGDFVTAKSAEYEDQVATGTCIAIEGDKIFVSDHFTALSEECFLDGAVIVPVAARVTASRVDDWQPRSESIKLPDHKCSSECSKDSTAFQALLAGIATSAVASIIAEHEVALDAIKIELRYTSTWVTTRPREGLRGGLIARGKGHLKYALYMNVSLDGDIEKDSALTLKCTHIAFEQIRDLDLIKKSVQVEFE